MTLIRKIIEKMYKVGDTVVYVNDIFMGWTQGHMKLGLTKYKKYTITNLSEGHKLCFVINDYGIEDFYNIKRFVMLTEYRKTKLEKIKEKICAR